MKYLNIFLLLLCNIIAYAQTPAVHILQQQVIFDTSSAESCHASTIVALGSDQYMAAWFAGTQEGNKDVTIWGSHRENGNWGRPFVLADGIQPDGSRYPCWNPVLFKSKEGRVYLHYKVGPNPREWWALYKMSTDNGKTWSAATPLPDSLLGPIKNKPLQLASGNIIYPSSTETNNHWQIHLEISDGQLKTWKKIAIPSAQFGIIQPSLLLHKDGRLQMLCRSSQNVIVQSWSADQGLTWSTPAATTIPNPNSGIDAVTLKDGTHLLVYNPLGAGKQWWEGRNVLTLAFSTDGVKWKDIYTLEEHSSGEYSYPAIIQDAEGKIQITYTGRRKEIRFIELELKFSREKEKSKK